MRLVAVRGPYVDARDKTGRPWTVTVRIDHVSSTHRFQTRAEARTFASNAKVRVTANTA